LAIAVGFFAFSLMAHHNAIRWFSAPGLLFFIVGSVLTRNALRALQEGATMDWIDMTEKYHSRTFASDSRLSSLPEEWQRELAALWRLEADVNNGAYLQFLQNWGKESYTYASQALKKIGAHKMAEIIDQCQTLVDEHFDSEKKTPEEYKLLMPNPIIGRDGTMIKGPGSVLPDKVVERIMALSYDFMGYPDDVARLGMSYYRTYLDDKD